VPGAVVLPGHDERFSTPHLHFVAWNGLRLASARCAALVVSELSGTPVGGRFYRLQPLLWEHEVPPIAGREAQQSVDYYVGAANTFDLCIFIFPSDRLGTEVIVVDQRFESGTVYEYENAADHGVFMTLQRLALRASSWRTDGNTIFYEHRAMLKRQIANAAKSCAASAQSNHQRVRNRKAHGRNASCSRRRPIRRAPPPCVARDSRQ
jgi:hypothetical protein